MYLVIQHTLYVIRHSEMTGPSENLEHDVSSSRLTLCGKTVFATLDDFIVNLVHLIVQSDTTADRSCFLSCLCNSVDDVDVPGRLYLDKFLVNRLRTSLWNLHPLSVLHGIDTVRRICFVISLYVHLYWITVDKYIVLSVPVILLHVEQTLQRLTSSVFLKALVVDHDMKVDV